MTASADDQHALDERLVEDDALLKMLEDREVAKGKKSEATKKYETMNNIVKLEVEKLGVEEDETVRVGRFKITKSKVDGRHVAFETEPTERLTIGPVKDEE